MRGAYQNLKRLFTYGLGSYGNDLLGNFSTYIDQIVIVGLLRPADLGLYVVAVSLSRMVNFSQVRLRSSCFLRLLSCQKNRQLS